MTVTPLPTAAEAPTPGLPRRLSLQGWLATQSRIDPTSAQNEDHRTWIELVAAHAFRDLADAFAEELEGAVDQALRDGILKPGGFLADAKVRSKVIKAALSSGCAEVMAGEVVQT
jgi:hypothetical protein